MCKVRTTDINTNFKLYATFQCIDVDKQIIHLKLNFQIDLQILCLQAELLQNKTVSAVMSKI